MDAAQQLTVGDAGGAEEDVVAADKIVGGKDPVQIVAADSRGEGVGTQLLAAFESEASARECTRLVVRTFSDSRAERFYRGRGWVEDARWRWVDGRVFLQLVRE